MMLTAARQSNEYLQAFIASEELDNAARYLRAGRRFAGLDNAALEAAWADAFRACHDHGWKDRRADCIDAEGELTLRQLPRPEHLIPPETRKRVADRIRYEWRDPETGRQLDKRYNDFVRRCTVWRN